MKAAAIELTGKMAHFGIAKYSNFLGSFKFPAKRTILGMLGAILGWERNRHLEVLNNRSLEVAVNILTEYRSIYQTVSLIDYKESIKKKKHNLDNCRPTLMELLVAQNFPCQDLAYRIFIWNDDEIINDVLDNIKKPVYPPCFGTLDCPAQISKVEEFTAEPQNYVKCLNSVCRDDFCSNIDNYRIEKGLPFEASTTGETISFKDYYFNPGYIKGYFEKPVAMKNKVNQAVYYVCPM